MSAEIETDNSSTLANAINLINQHERKIVLLEQQRHELLEVLKAALPYIDDAGDVYQFYSESSATTDCRNVVKKAHEAIKKVERQ